MFTTVKNAATTVKNSVKGYIRYNKNIIANGFKAGKLQASCYGSFMLPSQILFLNNCEGKQIKVNVFVDDDLQIAASLGMDLFGIFSKKNHEGYFIVSKEGLDLPFFMQHEIAHIILGHCDKHFESRKITVSDNQSWELEADAYAMKHSTLEEVIEGYKVMKAFHEEYGCINKPVKVRLDVIKAYIVANSL